MAVNTILGEVDFHIEQLDPHRWQIVYDEEIALEEGEYLSYEYDENDVPVRILKKRKDDK